MKGYEYSFVKKKGYEYSSLFLSAIVLILISGITLLIKAFKSRINLIIVWQTCLLSSENKIGWILCNVLMYASI